MSGPIVDDALAVRDAVAPKYGYDVKKLVDALREQQQKTGRKAVHRPSRKVWSGKRAS